MPDRSWMVLGSANGSTNLGDESMWESVVEFIRSQVGEAPIVTDGPAGWQAPAPDVHVLPFFHLSLRRGSFLPPGRLERVVSFPGRNQRAIRAALRPRVSANRVQAQWRDAIRASQGLIFSGAGAITDDYAAHGVAAWSMLARLAAEEAKPIAFVGQGVGPLSTPGSQRLTAEMFRRASLITVREQTSQDVLRGLDVRGSLVTPDWAIGNTPGNSDRQAAETLHAREIGGAPFIALCLHQRHNTGRGGLARLVSAAADILRFCDRTGRRCVFLPNMRQGGYANDLDTARYVNAHLPESLRGRLVIPDQHLSSRTTRAVLARADALFTTRYHPLVFAFSEQTPVVGLSYDDYYDQKLVGASKMFGVSENVWRLDSIDWAAAEAAAAVVPSVCQDALWSEVTAPLGSFLAEHASPSASQRSR